MKLWYSAASPFVRKVMIVARKTSLADKIEIMQTNTNVVDSDMELRKRNPLGKIPALETGEGEVLFDSRVICTYLATISQSDDLLPADMQARTRSQVLEALSDGIMDAAVLTRYEMALRPEKYRWKEWIEGQLGKVRAALDHLETGWVGYLRDHRTIGTISTACALGYLDYRFSDLEWRKEHGALAQWFSDMARDEDLEATKPPT